jgi:Rhodanese-related sulfurtransferase
MKQSMTYTTLVAQEVLARHLQDPMWVIMDCRFDLGEPSAGRRAYEQGHIPQARYAHLEEDLSSPKTVTSGRHPLPDPDKLIRKLGEWGVDGTQQVVAYDDSDGAMAARLWWLLRWLGHPAVAVLDGGFKRWANEGRPVTAATPPAAHAVFRGQIAAQAWVDIQAVVIGIRDGTYLVIDARARERFLGEVEPIDPVAGHIPGALNRPFLENLDASGNFASAEALRAVFLELIRSTPPDRVVHMCGSGVTACHNLLAMEISGLAGSRLYPGSWSEWIIDSRRPIASVASYETRP